MKGKLTMPKMDWQQVALNGGPPCFAVLDDEPEYYCGRAERWEGHNGDHEFVSLESLLQSTATTPPSLHEQARQLVDDLPDPDCDIPLAYLVEADARILEKRIASALAEAATAALEQAWIPIETAPKTGEQILLGHGNSVWEDEWWSPEMNWLECVEGGKHEGEIPSHWMPLPLPPPLIAAIGDDKQ